VWVGRTKFVRCCCCCCGTKNGVGEVCVCVSMMGKLGNVSFSGRIGNSLLNNL